jgi:HK97 family phage portal protein
MQILTDDGHFVRHETGLEKRGANPFLEWGTTAPPSPGSTGGHVGGLHVTQESASQIAAVYGCVSLLADSVAALPLRILDRPTPMVATAQELKPSVLITEPWVEGELTDWLVQFVWGLALGGEFWGQIVERDRDLYPTQIMPVPNSEASARRIRTGKEAGVIEYRFAGRRVNPDDVFHVKYQSMPGMVQGLNPIRCMKYPFGLAHVQDVWAAEVFRNMASPGGVIEVPNTLSPEATKQMVRDWMAAHQGPHLSNLPAVLTEGAKFNPTMLTPEDAQLLESRGFTESQICGRIFRVPPHMVGIVDRSTSWGRGIEQQERGFVVTTLQGYLTRIERAITRVLPKGQYANFDLSHRLRGTMLERAQAASLLMLCGAWCADDSRALFDQPALPEGKGKEVYAPINTEMYEKAKAEAEESIKAAKEEAKPMPGDDGFEEEEPGGKRNG